MNFVRISDKYERRVEEFIQFAQRNAINSGHDGAKIRCPCINCLNGRILDVNIVRIYGLKQEGGELFIRDFHKF